jgi:ABC-type glycerol-3-phosphate transport system substrate-binding protein
MIPAMVKRALLLSALALALSLGFAACGESEEEKAQNQVCDAREDIKAQVTELQQLTIGTATTDKIKTHLNAIKADFNKIADAQGELNDAQKQQVQNANEQFKSQVDDLITNLGTSVSLQDATARLKTSLTDLVEAYDKALSPIDC